MFSASMLLKTRDVQSEEYLLNGLRGGGLEPDNASWLRWGHTHHWKIRQERLSRQELLRVKGRLLAVSPA
jgi:hypothetical protein